MIRDALRTLLLSALLHTLTGCNEGGLPPAPEERDFSIVSGAGQTAQPNTTLPLPIIVELTRFVRRTSTTEPVGNAAVAWRTPDGGAARPETTMTDSLGRTSVTWTLGPPDGLQRLVAVDAGGLADSLTITATALSSGSCPATGGTEWRGVIRNPTTWGFGLHRITSTVFVENELNIQPGARICVSPGQRIEVRFQGFIQALGTPAMPIEFAAADSTRPWQGIFFSNDANSPSLLNDVRIEFSDRGIFGLTVIHTVRIDRAVIRESTLSAVRLLANGSDVTRSLIDRVRGGTEAVFLGIHGARSRIILDVTLRNAAGDGVRIQGADLAQATLLGCEITGCGGDGLVVEKDLGNVLVTVNGSNLFGNAGFGVVNLGESQVNAHGNWWGSPDGPEPPRGDGVSGDVDTSFFLREPAEIGERP